MSKTSAAQMVGEARTRIENLDPLEVQAALDGDTLVVDVREEHERIDGEVQGD